MHLRRMSKDPAGNRSPSPPPARRYIATAAPPTVSALRSSRSARNSRLHEGCASRPSRRLISSAAVILRSSLEFQAIYSGSSAAIKPGSKQAGDSPPTSSFVGGAMFEDSLVESQSRIRTQSKWFAIGSFLAQTALLLLLILYPLRCCPAGSTQAIHRAAADRATSATRAAAPGPGSIRRAEPASPAL